MDFNASELLFQEEDCLLSHSHTLKLQLIIGNLFLQNTSPFSPPQVNVREVVTIVLRRVWMNILFFIDPRITREQSK